MACSLHPWHGGFPLWKSEAEVPRSAAACPGAPGHVPTPDWRGHYISQLSIEEVQACQVC